MTHYAPGIWHSMDTSNPQGDRFLLKGELYSGGIYIEMGCYDEGFCIVNNGDYHDGGYGNHYVTGRGSDYSNYGRPRFWSPLPTSEWP